MSKGKKGRDPDPDWTEEDNEYSTEETSPARTRVSTDMTKLLAMIEASHREDRKEARRREEARLEREEARLEREREREESRLEREREREAARPEREKEKEEAKLERKREREETRRQEEARLVREEQKEEVRRREEEARCREEEDRRRADEQRWMAMFNKNAEEARKAELREQIRYTEEERRKTEAEESQRRRAEDARLARERDRRRAGRDAPSLRPLTDVQELETFLQIFKDHMQMYGVDREFWTSNLLPLLDAASLRFQERMLLAERRDFDTLTEALVAFHEINPNHYRVQWRDLVMMATESHQQLDQRLGIIFTRWAKEALATPELLMEHVCLEKLLSLMTDKIQTWVRSQKPTTRREAARMANDFCTQPTQGRERQTPLPRSQTRLRSQTRQLQLQVLPKQTAVRETR